MLIVKTGPKSNIQDFVPDLVICKLDENLIKNEVAIDWTTFSPLYVNGRLQGK